MPGGMTIPGPIIDLAFFLKAADPEEEMALIDEILKSSDKQIGILRIDDDEESPFIVQEALKGTHLIEPDPDILYDLYHRGLHETETIRFRRGRWNTVPATSRKV
jgi:uncharacterized protein